VWALLDLWPSVSAPVSRVLLGLPSVIMGAAVGASALNVDPLAAVKGAVAGALAPIIHHVLKALPVPYRGMVYGTTVMRRMARYIGSALCVCVCVGACVGALGCAPPNPLGPDPAARQACYEQATARYMAEPDCGPKDEPCWLAQGERYRANQEACA